MPGRHRTDTKRGCGSDKIKVKYEEKNCCAYTSSILTEMDFIKLKEKVLNSQDHNELYRLDIELTEAMISMRKAVLSTKTEAILTNLKGRISLCKSLLGICRVRQVEVREEFNRFNYDFRRSAQQMLMPDLYNAIKENTLHWHINEQEEFEYMKKGVWFRKDNRELSCRE